MHVHSDSATCILFVAMSQHFQRLSKHICCPIWICMYPVLSFLDTAVESWLESPDLLSWPVARSHITQSGFVPLVKVSDVD